MKPTISAVLPVYNGEATLPEVVARLQTVLSACAESHEIILVNDGSRDKSWELIQKLSRETADIRGFNLVRNFGQHNALLCGIRQARFELVVTLDDDLQHAPEDIPKLLAELDKGFDVVYGAPISEQRSWMRVLPSRAVKIALKAATQIEMTKYASAFRVFRTKLRNSFELYASPFVTIDVLLSWGTTSFSMVPVPHHARTCGQSGYGIWKLFMHAITMLTGFSAFPLHIVSILGFSLTVVGFVLLCFVLGRYVIDGGSVPGFPFLAASLAVFSGAQLFALGIIGEYLARMHFRMMGRPVYMIGERTEGGS